MEGPLSLPPDVPPVLSADGFKTSVQIFPAPFSPRGKGLAGRVILLTARRGNAAAKRISCWEASNLQGPPILLRPIKDVGSLYLSCPFSHPLHPSGARALPPPMTLRAQTPALRL